MNNWELIFSQSKVNDGLYNGDRLSTQNWEWPRQTWFQERLEHLRATQAKPLTDLIHNAAARPRKKRETALGLQLQ